MLNHGLLIIMIASMLMVAFAGLYALLYGAGKLFKNPKYIRFSYIFAAAQFLMALVIAYIDFLDVFWKILILISAVIYLFIPQGMWWVVHTSHTYWENQEKNKDI